MNMATKVEKCVSLGPYGQGQMPRVGLGTFTVFGQRVCEPLFIAGTFIYLVLLIWRQEHHWDFFKYCEKLLTRSDTKTGCVDTGTR